MTSNISTTSFPLGLFCTATLSGPIPEMPKRKSRSVRAQSLASVEPITDEEVQEITDDLCPPEKST